MYLLNIDKRGDVIQEDDGMFVIEEFKGVVEEFGLKGMLLMLLKC